jgi:hypothetical protein
MSWTRLPTFFPNFPLRMLPLAPEQLQQLRESGWVREVAFRTEPRINKVRRPANGIGPGAPNWAGQQRGPPPSAAGSGTEAAAVAAARPRQPGHPGPAQTAPSGMAAP